MGGLMGEVKLFWAAGEQDKVSRYLARFKSGRRTYGSY